MQNIIKKEGYNFAFDANACYECEGNCCIGESGYVWVNKSEAKEIASFLSLSYEEFVKTHLRKVRFRHSLKEVEVDKNNFVCEFFDLVQKRCQIYEVRPSQCRTFPFWDHFINNKKEVEKECPGILPLS
jgi:Fe-S-cluster containining protein